MYGVQVQRQMIRGISSRLLTIHFLSCFGGRIGPNGEGWLVFCKDSLNATNPVTKITRPRYSVLSIFY